MQTDPIGYGDGLNWYAYVGNDPLNARDPSGTLVWKILEKIYKIKPVRKILVNIRKGVRKFKGNLKKRSDKKQKEKNRNKHKDKELEINPDRQRRHDPESQEVADGRSELTENPQDLLDQYAGDPNNRELGVRGESNFKEQFDTGDKIIGNYSDGNGNVTPTTRGTIIYSKKGAHIVPARPRIQLPEIPVSR